MFENLVRAASKIEFVPENEVWSWFDISQYSLTLFSFSVLFGQKKKKRERENNVLKIK